MIPITKCGRSTTARCPSSSPAPVSVTRRFAVLRLLVVTPSGCLATPPPPASAPFRPPSASAVSVSFPFPFSSSVFFASSSSPSSINTSVGVGVTTGDWGWGLGEPYPRSWRSGLGLGLRSFSRAHFSKGSSPLSLLPRTEYRQQGSELNSQEAQQQKKTLTHAITYQGLSHPLSAGPRTPSFSSPAAASPCAPPSCTNPPPRPTRTRAAGRPRGPSSSPTLDSQDL